MGTIISVKKKIYKERVQSKIKFVLFTHPYDIPNLYGFLSCDKKEDIVFVRTVKAIGVNVVPTDFHCMYKQYTETFLKKSYFLCSAEKRKSTLQNH